MSVQCSVNTNVMLLTSSYGAIWLWLAIVSNDATRTMEDSEWRYEADNEGELSQSAHIVNVNGQRATSRRVTSISQRQMNMCTPPTLTQKRLSTMMHSSSHRVCGYCHRILWHKADHEGDDVPRGDWLGMRRGCVCCIENACTSTLTLPVQLHSSSSHSSCCTYPIASATHE